MLMGSMSKVFWLADVVLDMIIDPELDLKVLEVHNADYVKKPAETVKRICASLEVDCPEGYVQACKLKKRLTHVCQKLFPKQMVTEIGAHFSGGMHTTVLTKTRFESSIEFD